MSEGLSYLAGAELPALIVNVQRGGPGLGTIQPSQSDYNQACHGGAHGDFNLIVLAPASVQEMNDFVDLGFELAFKYRNPAMILAHGAIGQMMEKVVLSPIKPRRTEQEIIEQCGDWALTGRSADRNRNVVTSLELDSSKQEIFNRKLQAKYQKIRENEVRYEAINCEDAEYLMVAYGSSARICEKTMELAREKGIKVGLLRPITLFPFPTEQIKEIGGRMKGILSVELNAGQMVNDVRLAVECKVPVEHFGRMGGIIHSPEEVLEALTKIVR